ncbi:hypothetical protein [Ascidiaceihabitans sp.]|uniref:hypothetical protein n=1 Tax=Ascidiaceihabitans sp. TaxID=1872644 RepID=UPI0032994290
MTIVDWFKTLWPIVAILGAFGIRMEVGQALNKQRLRSVEKDIDHADRKSEKAIEGVHARLSRHENETNNYLSEIRNDIKTLLSRQ